LIEVIFADAGYKAPIMAEPLAKAGDGGWKSSSAMMFLVSRCVKDLGRAGATGAKLRAGQGVGQGRLTSSGR
jgi:hypothetical protein